MMPMGNPKPCDWQQITEEEYYALGGKEGGGFMGCVFCYDAEGELLGRRSFDDGDLGPTIWQYHKAIPPGPNDRPILGERRYK
jgi:hypothetical protein